MTSITNEENLGKTWGRKTWGPPSPGFPRVSHCLHVPGQGGADPSTYGVDANGNFTFTTHIDSAYSTWHTPIGALIHYFTDVRGQGAHRKPC